MARLSVTLALVLVACSGAWAATSPGDALRRVFAEADKILTDPKTEDRPLDRLLAVRKLVNETFDFRGAAELASGDHWRARTAAEQEEFTWIFADLLERAFISRMASTASLARGTRIRYLDESIDGDTALVHTAMARRDGGDLLVAYRLTGRDGSWKIRDVAIDGVSLMANYRAQLDRVLGNASFPELLSRMRAKVGVDVAPAKAVPPPAQTVSTMNVPLPAPEIRVATFEPVLGTSTVVKRPIAVATEVPASPPVKPATPSLVESPKRRTTKAYWLRLLAAGTAEEAGRLVSRLRNGTLSIAVDRTSSGGKLTVSVRVGPFHDAEQAVLKLLDLQTQGHDPYLVAERE